MKRKHLWELWEKCKHPHPVHGGKDMVWPEEFADLIIQECVDIADEYVRGDHGGIQGSPTAKSKIGIEIKKHFGVEE